MGAEPFSRRAFLSAAGLAGLSISAVGACGTSGPGGNGESGGGGGNGKTLQVWVLQDEAQNPIQQAAIGRFNASSATKLKLVPIASSGSSGYSDKLRVGMGSPQAPDIIFNWGSGSIRDYVQHGRLVDITSQLTSDTAWKGAFLPSVLDAGKLDGKYYGIPLRGMQPVLLFYNKTLFAEQGRRPPETYDDLVELVDFFKSKKIQPVALGGVDQFTLLMWLEYLVDRIGGAAVFDNIAAGRPGAWQDPAMKDALERIRDLVERGAFGTNFASVNYVNDGAGLLFARGKAAMHLMGSWEYTNQLDKHPEFAKKDLAFAPFPAVSGGKGDPGSVVGNPTNFFSVNSKADDTAAAISFLKKEMASPAYVDALIKAGDVPAVTGIDAKLAAAPNPEFARYVYQLVQQAPNFTLSWDQALPSRFKGPMLTTLQEVFVDKASPEEFVSTLGAVR